MELLPEWTVILLTRGKVYYPGTFEDSVIGMKQTVLYVDRENI
jgi:hypothetical protein